MAEVSASVDYSDDVDTPAGAAGVAAGKEPASPAAAARVSYNVLVVNPEKHGTGVSAYLTYEVRTSMTGGACGAYGPAVVIKARRGGLVPGYVTTDLRRPNNIVYRTWVQEHLHIPELLAHTRTEFGAHVLVLARACRP